MTTVDPAVLTAAAQSAGADAVNAAQANVAALTTALHAAVATHQVMPTGLLADAIHAVAYAAAQDAAAQIIASAKSAITKLPTPASIEQRIVAEASVLKADAVREFNAIKANDPAYLHWAAVAAWVVGAVVAAGLVVHYLHL